MNWFYVHMFNLLFLIACRGYIIKKKIGMMFNFFDVYLNIAQDIVISVTTHLLVYMPPLLFLAWVISSKKRQIFDKVNFLFVFEALLIILWYLQKRMGTTYFLPFLGLFIVLSLVVALIERVIETKKLSFFILFYLILISFACVIIFSATINHLYFIVFLCLLNPTLAYLLTNLNLLDKLENEERKAFSENMSKIIALKHIDIWACVRAFFFYAHVHILVSLGLNLDLSFLFVYVFLLVYPLKIIIQIYLTDISKRETMRDDIWEKQLHIKNIPLAYRKIENERYIYEIEDELLRLILVLTLMWILYFVITTMNWTTFARNRSTFDIIVICIRTVTSLIFNFPPLIQSIIQTLQHFTQKKLNTLFYFQMFPPKFFIFLLNKLYEKHKKKKLLFFFWMVILTSNLLSLMILMSMLSDNQFIPFFILCLVVSWPTRFFFNYSIASYNSFFKIAKHKNYLTQKDYRLCNFLERHVHDEHTYLMKMKEIPELKKITFYTKIMHFVSFTWFIIFIPFTIFFWETVWKHLFF